MLKSQGQAYGRQEARPSRWFRGLLNGPKDWSEIGPLPIFARRFDVAGRLPRTGLEGIVQHVWLSVLFLFTLHLDRWYSPPAVLWVSDGYYTEIH